MPAEPLVLLLVEDSEDIAMLFRRSFREFEPEWRLVWVCDGINAVKYCQEKGTPDAVVTDLVMPGMDGLELIAWFRAQGEECRPPILVYSSRDDADSARECSRAGADDFVSKSAPFATLRTHLRALCAPQG